MNQLHWHVLGAGAMGCLFAEGLARQDHKVTLLMRRPPAQKQVTLTVEDSSSSRNLDVASEGAKDPGIIEHLVVTTKAQDVCSAVVSLSHRLDHTSQVLLLSNGMGFDEELHRALPGIKPCFGTTTEAAYPISPGHIHHAGQGVTRIGRSGQKRPPPWFETWQGSLPRSQWVADIESALWQKLAVNCVINPLTALNRCPNGELARSPELAAQVDALCSEIGVVAARCGHARAVANLRHSVARVIEATGNNRSSMLQDVLAGRQTEINYINGYLVRKAEEHKLEAPLNQQLLNAIRALE